MTRQEWQIILNHALNGNERALGRVCQEYLKPKLEAFVSQKFQDSPEDVEDIVQDVFERLSEHYHAIEEHDLTSFTAFVFKMTANQCITALRQQKKTTSFTLTTAAFDLLRQFGVADEVAARLTSLENIEVLGQHNFLRRLKALLPEQEYRQAKTTILQVVEQARKQVAEMLCEPADQHIEQLAAMNEQAIQELVNAIRAALRPEEFDVLWQHDVEGQTFRQLTVRFGVTLGALHARHQRILETLQRNKTLRAWWNDLRESLDVPQTTLFALRSPDDADRDAA